MPFMLAVASRESATGNIRDSMVNTFWFNSAGKVNGDNIADMLEDYFNEMTSIRSTSLYSRDLRIQLYDQDDPSPRVSWYDETRVLDAATFEPLPREVAMAMTFGAQPISGVPAARRRGRVYIGGLRRSIVGDDGRPTTAAIRTLAGAGAALVAASTASLSHSWVVYSRANDAGYVVLGGRVDNAFDTQRRRGDDPTEFQTFTDVLPPEG